MFNQDRNRGTGRTTRIKNHCVERLLNEGFVIVYDHYPSREANHNLVREIIEDLDVKKLLYQLNSNKGEELNRRYVLDKREERLLSRNVAILEIKLN